MQILRGIVDIFCMRPIVLANSYLSWIKNRKEVIDFSAMLLLVLEGEKKSGKLRSLWLILSSLPRSPIHQDLSPSIDEARSQKPCDENPPYNDTPSVLHKLNQGRKYSSLSIFICRATTPANFKDNYRYSYKRISFWNGTSCIYVYIYVCDINWNVKCLLWSGIGAQSQYWVNPSVVHSQAYLLTNVNQIVIAAQIILQNVKSNIYFYFSSQSQRIWCDIRSFIFW